MKPITFWNVWWVVRKRKNRSWNPFLEELDILFGVVTQIDLIDKYTLYTQPRGEQHSWSIATSNKPLLMMTYSEYIDTLSPLNISPCLLSPSFSFLTKTESAVTSIDWEEVEPNNSLSSFKVDLESLKSSLRDFDMFCAGNLVSSYYYWGRISFTECCGKSHANPVLHVDWAS